MKTLHLPGGHHPHFNPEILAIFLALGLFWTAVGTVIWQMF